MDLSVHHNNQKKDPWIFQSIEIKVITCVAMILCICPYFTSLVATKYFFIDTGRSMDPLCHQERQKKDPWIFGFVKKKKNIKIDLNYSLCDICRCWRRRHSEAQSTLS